MSEKRYFTWHDADGFHAVEIHALEDVAREFGVDLDD